MPIDVPLSIQQDTRQLNSQTGFARKFVWRQNVRCLASPIRMCVSYHVCNAILRSCRSSLWKDLERRRSVAFHVCQCCLASVGGLNGIEVSGSIITNGASPRYSTRSIRRLTAPLCPVRDSFTSRSTVYFGCRGG